MTDIDKSLDELHERLILDRLIEEGWSPPYGGYGTAHSAWMGYQWRTKSVDTVYRNKKGEYHRIYGPAYISEKYDVEIWYKEGKYHREDGPAVRHKHSQMWYYEGELHRIGGPAMTTLGGPAQYWIRGQRLSPKEYKKEMMRRRRKGLIK